jgi:CBS domain-containing protein
MKTVADILQTKGREVWTITPETIVFDALKMMADKNVGALVVMDGAKVTGIVSERDYARKVILHGRSSRELETREIMSTNVYFVSPKESIEECMTLFTNKHVRHLPVLQEEQLIGIISIGDVVKAVIAEQEYTIKHLENYITGGR